MSFSVFVGMMVLSFIQLLYFLRAKQFVSTRQATILACILVFQFLWTFLFNSPYTMLGFLVFSILQPIFIMRHLNNWLSMIVFLYLQSALFILSWLFTYDFVNFFVYLGKIPVVLAEQIMPMTLVAQQLLLFILTIIVRYVDRKYKIFDSVAQVQKNYKWSAVCLTILLMFLSIGRHSSILLSSDIDFSYLTFILLTLCIIVCLTAYLYSRYYQQRLKKALLYQQYNSEVEKMRRSDEFRHDYQNILISLMAYVKNDELSKALDFVSSIERYSKNLLEEADYDQLNQLAMPSVQGLLIHFIEECEEKNIQLKLSIPQLIQETDSSIQLIDFIHCLSAVLDYAIVYRAIEKDELFSLSFTKKNNTLSIELKNSNEQQLNEIKSPEYLLTNKRILKNYGLASVINILNKYRNTSFSFYSHQQTFLIQFSLPLSCPSLAVDI